jgi:hypothetical protein
MLAEISTDRSILIPGDTVESGRRRVIVYPLALCHFQTHAKEVAAVYGAIASRQTVGVQQRTAQAAVLIGVPVIIADGPVSEVVSVEVDGRTLEAMKEWTCDPLGMSLGSILILSGARPGEIANVTYVASGQVDDVMAMSVEVAKVLLTTGFRLLKDCCVKPLDDSDALTADAAGVWAAASIDSDLLSPVEEYDGHSVPLTFRLAVSRLVAAGHRVADIFSTVQPGFPYPGWTLAQFNYWRRADDSRRARMQAEDATASAMAISACFGKDDGFQAYVEGLRAV